MTKADIIKALETLPEDATVEDAMDRLFFLSKIERGLAQADAGQTITHDEVVRQMKQWGK